MLKKETVLYPRDEKGELIPVEVELVIDENDSEQISLKGETVMITPLTRGELRRVYSGAIEEGVEGADIDAELIVEHCKNPSFTKEDIQFMKPAVTAVINTILYESGIDVLKTKTKKEAVEKKEDEFGKN